MPKPTRISGRAVDGDPGDLFAWQDEIPTDAVALDLELVDAAAARPSERPTHDTFPRRAVRLKPPSRENRAEAVALFERVGTRSRVLRRRAGWRLR
jgi:hypothetical protein